MLFGVTIDRDDPFGRYCHSLPLAALDARRGGCKSFTAPTNAA